MKYDRFTVGAAIWAVVLVLSVVLFGLFQSIWFLFIYLILALPVTALVLWEPYKKAWNEGYDSYGQPKKRPLRDELKRLLWPAQVLLVLYLVFLFVICWPLMLISLFGYFRGKRAAQKSDEDEQKSSG